MQPTPGMSRQEIIITLKNCTFFGNYKFFYISPERLQSELFRTKLRKMNVSMITVDESHCISQWGYNLPVLLSEEVAKYVILLPGVPGAGTDCNRYSGSREGHPVAQLFFRQENVLPQ